MKAKTKDRLITAAAVILIAAGGFSTSGCSSKEPLRVESTDNAKYRVALLFTHNGCSVFRFTDSGYPRYFANCSSSISSFHMEAYPCSDGKGHTCYRSVKDETNTYVEEE